MSNKRKKIALITYKDIEGDIFSGFTSDKERIKYMSRAYANMSLSKAFQVFYDLKFDDNTLKNTAINKVYTLELGQIYNGYVESFGKNGISFSIPGVKSEIVCKENLADCTDSINNYLLTHNNKLLFEVREKKNNTYYVSIINAYYNAWVKMIEDAIKNNNGIQVHIDELVHGGYICHVPIKHLVDLTGKMYTHSVFIPGSHIVLNIENDFEKWVGEDVIIVPQKFVDFKRNFKTGEVEKSLVGSRKKVLQILGNNNLYDIWKKYNLANDNPTVKWDNSFDGIVTGIINSQKKTGIFVEIKDKFITGLAQINAIDLIDYKPGDAVKVRISEFECKEGFEPFVFNRNNGIKECNIRPVFEII
jgi:ribosomal protein S1